MNVKRGITWTLMDTLEDLDFADDIVLFAHRHQDIQRKTNDVVLIGRQVGLKDVHAKIFLSIEFFYIFTAGR